MGGAMAGFRVPREDLGCPRVLGLLRGLGGCLGVWVAFEGGLGVPLEAGDPLTLPFCPPRDYAAIVFFANSRFETGKRRLQFLTFGDFAACAQSMMGHWSQGALGEPPETTGTPPQITPNHPGPLGIPPNHPGPCCHPWGHPLVSGTCR